MELQHTVRALVASRVFRRGQTHIRAKVAAIYFCAEGATIARHQRLGGT